LERPTTLHDSETNQVEFVRATGIQSQRLYIYDGAKTEQYSYYSPEQIRNEPGYDTTSNPKVWVMQELKNSEANHLGIALPKGRLRFYRRDTDGSLQFVGENTIDHTPKDEMIRVYTGNAFDIVGERKRTNYHVDSNQHWMDETFEVRVRNHKKEATNVRVVEHLTAGRTGSSPTNRTNPKNVTLRRLSSRLKSRPMASRSSTTPYIIRGD